MDKGESHTGSGKEGSDNLGLSNPGEEMYVSTIRKCSDVVCSLRDFNGYSGGSGQDEQ